MRLIDTSTGRIVSVEGPATFPYAILSHVWAKEGRLDFVPEQTYEDVLAIQAKSTSNDILPLLSQKIQRACSTALRHGYLYIWIDTCCINKANNTELSEAINSMYGWYSASRICYAYLADVDDEDDPQRPDSQFRNSRWFTRAGWYVYWELSFCSETVLALDRRPPPARSVENIAKLKSHHTFFQPNWE